MASCPGLQFDWSATAELCTLVVPHILSAACTTVTRLHGVTSQNSAVLNQQTMWRSAVQPDTFHNFVVLFPVLPTYRQLTVKLLYFKELPHIFQDHVLNCFVLLLQHKCSIKTHLDTCQYLHDEHYQCVSHSQDICKTSCKLLKRTLNDCFLCEQV
jgi:hypothetical protein